jgi:CRP-like cAMP-binding protein
MTSSAQARAHDSMALQARQLLWPYLRARSFAAGEVLWREGDTDGMLVAVEEGRMKAYRTLADGRPITLYIFRPGDVFGFIPLLDGEPYPATAEALDDVKARVLSRSGLREAIRERPDLALTLMSILAQRLRQAFDRIQGLSSRGVVPRVAAAIEALVTTGEHPLIIELPASAAEFAGAIGVSAESFSRAVTRLCEDGILHRLGRGRLQLLDGVKLHETAGPVEG